MRTYRITGYQNKPYRTGVKFIEAKNRREAFLKAGTDIGTSDYFFVQSVVHVPKEQT